MEVAPAVQSTSLVAASLVETSQRQGCRSSDLQRMGVSLFYCVTLTIAPN